MYKKVLSVLICAALILFLCPVASAAQRPSVSALSSVLMDALTGEILFSCNKDLRLSMASTTKIMTCVIALESGRLGETVCVDPEAVKVEGTSLGLCGGDKLTLYDLCVGLMLSSGNDAANAIAVFLSGSLKSFAERMNIRALSLSMNATSFVTPSGLDSTEHFTTACDMAVLAAYAMSRQSFSDIVSMRSASITFINTGVRKTIYNHNKLLDRYQYCTGIKTGYTKKSGRCLVSSAEKNGIKLICVTLHAPDDWNDHIKLFEYGFEHYKPRDVTVSTDEYLIVTGGTRKKVALRCAPLRIYLTSHGDSALKYEILIPPFDYAPVAIGDTAGEIRYTVDGKTVAQAPLVIIESSDCIVRVTRKKTYFEIFASLLTG